MKQHKFDSYQDYVEAQSRLTLRNLKKGKVQLFKEGEEEKAFCHSEVVEVVAEDYPHKCKTGICHGARNGVEVRMFEKSFGGTWIGTDICEEVCDGKWVLCQDFDDVPNDWINAFDVIYSNALDHSRNPKHTVSQWLSCLSDIGFLYIEWTKWSNKLGRGRNRADCYAANLEEYRDLLNSCGIIKCVLDLKPKGSFKRIIFVVTRQ